MAAERFSYHGDMGPGLLCRLRVVVSTPPDLDGMTYGEERASAILDSGSEVTLIRHSLASRLGLPHGRRKEIAHPTTPRPIACFTTTARLGFLAMDGSTQHLIRQLYICEQEMDVDVLIGLDCFEDGEVRINVPRKTWSVQIPPPVA